jgi:hypothetical protein
MKQRNHGARHRHSGAGIRKCTGLPDQHQPSVVRSLSPDRPLKLSCPERIALARKFLPHPLVPLTQWDGTTLSRHKKFL